MRDAATFRRTTAVVGLVGAVVTSAVWTLLEPAFPADPGDRLAAIADGGTGATISAVAFAGSQLFMLAAVLGIAHVIRRGAPMLSNLGATLSVVGVLGHAVYSGTALMTVTMAADEANREMYGELITDFESSPFMAIAAAGLLGTVLGILLLSIGLWRSRVTPRWIPAAMWTFLVVEFVGSALSDYATYASLVCLGLAFGALALFVARTPRSDWEPVTAPTAQPRADQRETEPTAAA